MSHPNGSVQGICTSAMGWTAMTITFMGFRAFGANSASSPWTSSDIPYLGLCGLGFAFLAFVPFVSTAPGSPFCSEERKMQIARWLYLIGAVSVLIGVIWSLWVDYSANHR